MWNNLSGIFHLLVSIATSLYPFVFAKNPVDYLYICYALFILTHWTMMNGECIITYWAKKRVDPSYSAGENPMENTDMYVLPMNDFWNNALIQIICVVWLYAIYRVYVRNKYPKWIPLMFIVIFGVYKFELVRTDDHIHDARFQYRQTIIRAIMCMLVASTLYYTMYR